MSDEAPLWLVRLSSDEAARRVYSLEAAAQLTAVHPDLLRRYCQMGLLGEARATTNAELLFDDHALYDIRCLERYRRLHGVNLRALPLVWSLAKQVERLRRELRFWRDRS